MTPVRSRLAVAEVITETVDAVTIVFDLPGELAESFRYRPGQFLTVQVPSDECGSVARCYSLSTSPHCDPRPAITVKRTRDGYASNWICDNIAAGSIMTVLEPAGNFVPATLDADVLLCAAGSGITPILSILKSILTEGSASAILFYANQHSDTVIFADQIRDLTTQFAERLTVVHWFESDNGLPTASRLASTLSQYYDRDVYVCGPEGFIAEAIAALARIGVPADRVMVEQYRSLNGNPFSATPEKTATTAEAEHAWVTVELDGQVHRLAWARTTPLLDVLIDAGLDPPYVCRESACGSCVCSVKVGRTRMLLNEALIEDEIQQGLTLACQTLPESDDLYVAFDQ